MNQGKLGEAAKEIGGTLVLPPLPERSRTTFGHEKQFPDVSKLRNMVGKSVPPKTCSDFTDPASSLEYGNHSTVDNDMELVWNKLVDSAT